MFISNRYWQRNLLRKYFADFCIVSDGDIFYWKYLCNRFLSIVNCNNYHIGNIITLISISHCTISHVTCIIFNYFSLIGLIRSMGRVKKEMRLTRYFTYMLVSVWKIVAFFISTILILHLKGEQVGHLFTMFSTAFGDHKLTVTPIRSSTVSTAPDLTEILIAGGDPTETISAVVHTPIYVLLLQITGAYFAYVFGERIKLKLIHRDDNKLE